MISIVISESGNTKGYLIDSLYIKKDLLKYFTPLTCLQGKRVIGKSVKDSIQVQSEIYEGIVKKLSINNIHNVLKTFKSNSIPLNDILFVPCKVTDVVFEGKSKLWSVVQGINKFYKCCACIDSNGDVVSYLLSYNDLYKDSVFYINMFEVIDKNKGVGTKVIRTLKQTDKVLEGLALVSSLGFWVKVGGVFTEGQHFVI